MVEHFRVVQLPAVLAGSGASCVLLALAVGTLAVRTTNAGTEQSEETQSPPVGSGLDPLRCQPFVVLYRMDRAGNRDGILDPGEIPRGAESFVQRLVSESKVASPQRTPLRHVAIAWHRRAPSSTGRLPKSTVIQRDRSRSVRRKPLAGNRDHAANLLGLYDRNANGSLDRDEWSQIGPGWNEADIDGNGVLSLDELSNRLMAYEQATTDSTPADSTGLAPKDRRQSAPSQGDRTGSPPSQGRRSYRVRTPHERLPAGIPGWYIQKDEDRDGQILMVEYARAWNDEKLAEFNRYDLNRDGIITPRECLKAERQR